MKRPNLEAMDEGAARFDSELSNVISWAMNRERRVAELEGERAKSRAEVERLKAELSKSRMDCINARLAFDEADGAHQSAERSVSHHIEERARLEALLNQHGISPGPAIRIGESKEGGA